MSPQPPQQVLAKDACPVCRGDVLIDRSPIAPDSDEQDRYLEKECTWWAWEGDPASCLACKAKLVVRVDDRNAWLELADGSEP